MLAPPLPIAPSPEIAGRSPARGERRRCRPGDRDAPFHRLRARGRSPPEDLQAAEDLFGAATRCRARPAGGRSDRRRRGPPGGAALRRRGAVLNGAGRGAVESASPRRCSPSASRPATGRRRRARRATSRPAPLPTRGGPGPGLRARPPGPLARGASRCSSAYLDGRPDPEAAALLERFRRDRGCEGALDEARLAHFHVRYDGEAHEDVGREILRVLERHYATLVRTFDHQPAAPIPVILLSQRELLRRHRRAGLVGRRSTTTSTAASASPSAGSPTSLTPELDGTLIHELTHAFVADLSRGLAPREIHEGLAQCMEGERLETRLGDEGSARPGRRPHPGRRGRSTSRRSPSSRTSIAQRGQGGINELLRAMARDRQRRRGLSPGLRRRPSRSSAARLGEPACGSATAADGRLSANAQVERQRARSAPRSPSARAQRRNDAPRAARAARARTSSSCRSISVSRRPFRSGQHDETDLLASSGCRRVSRGDGDRRRPGRRARSTRPTVERLGARPHAALRHGVDLAGRPLPPLGGLARRTSRRRPRSGPRTFARSSSFHGSDAREEARVAGRAAPSPRRCPASRRARCRLNLPEKTPIEPGDRAGLRRRSRRRPSRCSSRPTPRSPPSRPRPACSAGRARPPARSRRRRCPSRPGCPRAARSPARASSSARLAQAAARWCRSRRCSRRSGLVLALARHDVPDRVDERRSSAGRRSRSPVWSGRSGPG